LQILQRKKHSYISRFKYWYESYGSMIL